MDARGKRAQKSRNVFVTEVRLIDAENRRIRELASVAKVSAKSELLPEPDTPTTIVAFRVGRTTSTD